MKYYDAKTGEPLELVSKWTNGRDGCWAYFNAKSGAVFAMYENDVIDLNARNRHLQLAFQINNRIKTNHNAACPKCLDTWEFDTEFAWLSEKDKSVLLRQGYLHILCEDCERDEDIEEFIDLLHEWNIPINYNAWEDKY